MKSHYRYTVDLYDLESGLKARSDIPASVLLKNSDNILIGNFHEFRKIDFGIFLHNQNFDRMNALVHYRLIRRNFVSFQFLLNGSVNFIDLGRSVRSNGGTVRVTVNFNGFSETPPREEAFRAVSIYIEKEKLVDEFGLDVMALPEHVRPMFMSGTVPQTVELQLGPASWLAVEDLIKSKFVGLLREQYFRAKAVELLTLTVASLNTTARGLQLVAASAVERHRQAVEAAALIYRRELMRPPSIDEIAQRVGLNRNTLTDAFRERFDETPAEHSRRLRLNLARQQLVESERRISEISIACGYTSQAAFTRAFLQQFGVTPSSLRRA
ncbi:helix-turn-helix domain-containing protein [Bosea sp. (in: a-proteobacteria)]|uniref:helix-turn-helix domain-containing protein n=1 Tax=Bosea sp. (in: a-proteobacteria) TaxID=1871050 RepID=UPI003B3B3AE7